MSDLENQTEQAEEMLDKAIQESKETIDQLPNDVPQ
jgi:hypothetical protein